MLDSLVNVMNGAWWVYALVAFLSAFDVVFPLLPSETAVITGGIIAAKGDLLLPFILIAAAVGAFGGDNLAHWIGRNGQDLARRWLLRGEKGQRAIDWADRMLDKHGGTVIIVGRFVPGGRTATTVGSGIVEYPWRRFASYDAVGAITWATVNSVIGYIGGKVFRDKTWLAFLVSFGVAVAVAGLVEVVRWLVARRHGGSADEPTDRAATTRAA